MNGYLMLMLRNLALCVDDLFDAGDELRDLVRKLAIARMSGVSQLQISRAELSFWQRDALRSLKGHFYSKIRYAGYRHVRSMVRRIRNLVSR